MPRRDKRAIEKTSNPYAPFSFMYGMRRVLFVPKSELFRGAKPRSRIMDMTWGKSKKIEIYRRKK